MYRYRREDGTEFEIRQKFSDDPLTMDPETGLAVVRVIQPTGIVFKGSGFYVNDSRSSGTGSNRSTKGDTSDTSDDKPKTTESPESSPAKETKATTSSSVGGSDAAD